MFVFYVYYLFIYLKLYYNGTNNIHTKSCRNYQTLSAIKDGDEVWEVDVAMEVCCSVKPNKKNWCLSEIVAYIINQNFVVILFFY